MNDIVPIVLPSPQNSTVYNVIIQTDVNGYTWNISTAAGGAVATGSNLYGALTGQFATQALMYTQYYMKHLEVHLDLTQGGGVFSVSPMVELHNPNGVQPFQAGSNFISLISAPTTTGIFQTIAKHKTGLNYEKWLMAMTDRAWRKSISVVGSGRELYPSDGATDQDFVVPSVAMAFQIAIPEARFEASGSNTDIILGLFKTQATYCFSQRRTDINSLVDAKVQLEVEKGKHDRRHAAYPHLN